MTQMVEAGPAGAIDNEESIADVRAACPMKSE